MVSHRTCSAEEGEHLAPQTQDMDLIQFRFFSRDLLLYERHALDVASLCMRCAQLRDVPFNPLRIFGC